jgi:feruloyl esterase
MRHCISTTFLVLALRLGALASVPIANGAPSPSVPGHSSPLANSMAAACTALASKVSELIPGYPVSNVVNEILPANSTFNQGTYDYAQPVVDLPELCRFGAYFNTSSKSAVKFEVWMPTRGWNGRFAFNGNVRLPS